MQHQPTSHAFKIEIPTDIRKILDEAATATSSISALADLITVKKQDLEKAESELAEAERLQQSGHSDYDLTDAAQLDAFTKATHQQEAEIHNKRVAVSVAKRVHAAFVAKAEGARGDLIATTRSLESALTDLSAQARKQFSNELMHRLSPAFRFMLQGYALHAALNCPNIAHSIDESSILNSGDHNQPLLQAGAWAIINGDRVNLRQIWDSDPDAKELFDSLAPIREARKQLRALGRASA